MATFNDLFGKNESGAYLKWNEVGDAFAMVVTGEPDARSPQVDWQTKKTKHMVQVSDGDKWAVKLNGDFDPDSVHKHFPLTQIAVPVRVYQKTTKAGKVEDFEEFETTWELTKEMTDKLKEEMAETSLPLEKGVKVQVKFLIDGKPRKFSVKLKPAE